MPASRQLPIRILNRGASLTHAMSEFPQRRGQYPFGRVLEESLLADGYLVDVNTVAVASQEMRHGFASWEQDVKAYMPDVVILTLGYFETIHLILPRWLERHANSLARRPGTVRSRYRQYLLRPFWKALARVQQRLDRIVGARFFAPKARRHERLLRAYLDQTLKAGAPMVVLFEFLEPGARGRDWFPGMAARVRVMNEVLHRVVDDYDRPEVRLLPVPALMAEHLGGTEPNADGFHFTAEGHAVIGEALADLVREFAASQPRLQPVRPASAMRATGS